MNTHFNWLIVALLGTTVAWGQDRSDPTGRSAVEDGVEVLTRGPVHEAFAGTITFDPEPGVVVMRPAPEPIEELPPEQKPTGDNVAWIPGYWGWDDEREDFLWVSGVWRALPPGRQWISGYWATSAQKSQWTSGYWADAQAAEVEYLPEPPQTVEAGPNVEAPSADHTWLPGVWVWQQNRYAWRPGYWATAQPNWVWNPPHYVWAPRGYVYVDGYYDYPVARRGVLYAPVYLDSSVYSQRGYSFSPRTVINPAVFAAHLFLRPSYGHYYFGDYYGSNYATNGYSPWFSFANSRMGYDPFYAHQNWTHRNEPQWSQQVATEFANLQENDDARPPRTWSDQIARRQGDAATDDKSLVVATSIEELGQNERAALRFKPLAAQEREQFGQRGQQVREAREERRKLEAETVSQSADTPAGDAASRNRVKLPKSPVAALASDQLDGDNAPPKLSDAPEPDAKVQPQPRRPRGNVDPAQADPKAPKTDPKPGDSPAKPGAPQDAPKPNVPKGNLNAPAGEPQPRTPRGTPGGDGKPAPAAKPKAAPQPGEKPASPSDAPRPAPKVSPNAEAPKAAPKATSPATPRAERPATAPKAAPSAAPKETPKASPPAQPRRGEQPRAEQPRAEQPKAPRKN